MRRAFLASVVLTAVFSFAVTSVDAAPVTYDFSATLSVGLNGNSTVTGSFTLDTSTSSISTFDFTEPDGVFDNADATALIFTLAATSPVSATFIQLGFVNRPGDFLSLLFQIPSLASFDPSTFYSGGITTLNGPTYSGVACTIVPPTSSACTSRSLYASVFASGTVTAAPPSAVPEPATVTMAAMGFIGFARWRRQRVSTNRKNS